MHDKEVELGDEVRVRVRRPLRAIFAMRLSRELMVELDEYARARHLTISAVLREAATRLIHPTPPSRTVSESTAITMNLEGTP